MDHSPLFAANCLFREYVHGTSASAHSVGDPGGLLSMLRCLDTHARQGTSDWIPVRRISAASLCSRFVPSPRVFSAVVAVAAEATVPEDEAEDEAGD